MILLPVLVARLGVEGYGCLALVMSLSLIFSNVLTLRLPLAVIRFYPNRRENAGAVVLVGLLYWAFLVAGAIALFLLFGKPIATYVFAKPGMTRLLGASLAVGLSSMLYEFATITLRAESRFKFISLVDGFERILFVTATSLVLWFGSPSVDAVCVILVLTTILKVLAAVGPALNRLRWTLPDQELARKMFVFSLPYLPYMASVWLLERSPFVCLERSAGPALLGVFAVAFSLAGVLETAMGPLQTVLYPQVRKAYDTRNYSEANQLFTLALRITLAVGAFGAISLCLGVRHIFQLLSIHSAIPNLFLLITLSTGITLTLVRHIFVVALNLELNTKVLAWTCPVVAVLSLPVYFVLIQMFGADGAGLAFALSTAVQTAVLRWYVPTSLRAAPAREYFFALVCSMAGAGVVQWLFGWFGPWSYLSGLLLSTIVFMGMASWSGGVSEDEKRTLFGLIQRWIRYRPVKGRLIANKN